MTSHNWIDSLIAAVKQRRFYGPDCSGRVLSALIDAEVTHNGQGWRCRQPGERYWVAIPELTHNTDDALRLLERLYPEDGYSLTKTESGYGFRLDSDGERPLIYSDRSHHRPAAAICDALLQAKRHDMAAASEAAE